MAPPKLYGMTRKSPPPVKQPVAFDTDLNAPMITSTCWAAALSSWLTAARDDDWTVDSLVHRFQPYIGKQGLDLIQFDNVATAGFVNMQYEEIEPGQLTFEYLYEKLMTSYVYLIKSGSNPAHAVVAHKVTRDTMTAANAEIGIMDPIKGVLVAGSLDEFRKSSRRFIVGWATYP